MGRRREEPQVPDLKRLRLALPVWDRQLTVVPNTRDGIQIETWADRSCDGRVARLVTDVGPRLFARQYLEPVGGGRRRGQRHFNYEVTEAGVYEAESIYLDNLNIRICYLFIDNNGLQIIRGGLEDALELVYGGAEGWKKTVSRSVRLRPLTAARLDKLANYLGLNGNEVIEEAVSRLFEAELSPSRLDV